MNQSKVSKLLSVSYPQLSSVRVKELCELLSYWNGASFICKSQVSRVSNLPSCFYCAVIVSVHTVFPHTLAVFSD